MTTIVSNFMRDHFNNLPLRPPLFYSWAYGLRFEISIPGVEHEDKNNLQQIHERSTRIFNRVFQDTDKILLITDVHCEKNDTFLQKRPANIYKKYVKNRELLKTLTHTILPSVFPEEDGDDEDMVTHRFVLPCNKSDIRYHQLLTAISYEDFPHPARILKRNYNNSSYDIYFVNVTQQMIYHLYDDRGCDVIASDKEDLRQLYVDFNDWILDYDREEINLLFRDC